MTMYVIGAVLAFLGLLGGFLAYVMRVSYNQGKLDQRVQTNAAAIEKMQEVHASKDDFKNLKDDIGSIKKNVGKLFDLVREQARKTNGL